MIPTDDEFVESVAKSIARARLHKDAAASMGITVEIYESFEPLFDRMFEALWLGDTDYDELQRISYRQDAVAAINAINLKLITAID